MYDVCFGNRKINADDRIYEDRKVRVLRYMSGSQRICGKMQQVMELSEEKV